MAFDIIGGREKAVAILELPKGINPKQAAAEIMRRHPNVKSVLAKAGARTGIKRIYRLRLITGSKGTEVIHQEHGMKFKLDPRSVYFSPREAEERQRVAKTVKPKERVLVMFAGAGPFMIAIAKAQPSAHIEGIEINPAGVKYALENIRLNGIGLRAKIHEGDAKVAPELGKFDRILMPLPESAWKFLPAAFNACRKGGIIHLYGISGQSDFSDLQKHVEEISKKCKIKYMIIGKQRVLPYAPHTWKVRLDIKSI